MAEKELLRVIALDDKKLPIQIRTNDVREKD